MLDDLSPENLRRPTRVAFVNAHAANLADTDAGFLSDLVACEYILRDGIGMKVFMRWIQLDPGLNMNGTDFIPQILDLYRSQSVALLGTQSPYLERAGTELTKRGHVINLQANGFHDVGWYVDQIVSVRPTLVVLAMGMPKQERVAAELAERLEHPCLIICGGAILDFVGGRVTRAPGFVRALGLEWLYRLALEPKRLFRRYVFGTAKFVVRSIQARA